MTFLTPLVAILAAAVALPLLVLMYFLKLRRRQVEVPTTLLWRKSIQDMQASAPFQKLRRNLLLLLQLLVLIGLLIALARPTVDGWASSGKRLVIVIDHSASMNATDVSPTRLDEARKLALALARDASRGQGAMIVSLGYETQIVEPFTEDIDRLERAINSITPTDEPGRLEPALTLLEQFAKQESGLEVYIISDGRFPASHKNLLEGHATIRLLRVGGDQGGNLGVVAMTARRDFQNPNRVEIYSGLTNDSPQTAKVKLAVKIDGKLAQILDVLAEPTPPGQETTTMTPVSFSMENSGSSLVEVEISRATMGDEVATDSLAADNRAWVMVSPHRSLRALVVGEPSLFTSRAVAAAGLAAVDPVSIQAYEAMAVDPAKMANYDMVLFDRYEPAYAGTINALYLGTGAPAAGIKRVVEQEEIAGARVVLSWQREHELMRYAGLDELVLGQTVRLEVPVDAQVLATTAAGPLIASVQRQGRRTLVVGFDPIESNWPLLVGFPVFVSNAVQWLGAAGVDQGGLVSRPGMISSVPFARGRTGDSSTIRFEAVGVSGSLTTTTSSGRLIISPARHVGVYLTRDENLSPPWNTLAVSLLDSVESDLRPVDELVVGTQAIETVAPQSTQVREEAHHWFLWAVLVILLGEWFVYLRRSRM